MNFDSIARKLINKFFENRLLSSKIFFLHIPKCGGTSINNAIASCYNIPIGSKRNVINLDASASLEASKLFEMDLHNYRKYLLPYFMSMKHVQFISGHFFLNEKICSEYCNRWDFITILRHPVARWFSLYFYNRYKTSNHFKIKESLESFVESDIGNSLGHYYISMLTGCSYKSKMLSKKSIDDAISILKKFAIVGCLEHLRIFKKQFYRKYGKALTIKELNKSPIDQIEQNRLISTEIKKKVEDICQPDLEVYEFALNQLRYSE